MFRQNERSLKQRQPFHHMTSSFLKGAPRALQLRSFWRMAPQALFPPPLLSVLGGGGRTGLCISGSEACCQHVCLPVLPHQVAMFRRPRIQLHIPPALSLTEPQQGSIQKGTVNNVKSLAMRPLYSSPTLHAFIRSFKHLLSTCKNWWWDSCSKRFAF